MSDITITKPTLADVDTLWCWGEENWELWGDNKYKWFSKKTLFGWINEPKEDVLLVARDGARLVGMCMMSVIHDWAFCFGLFVEKTYRGKGIGKQLLAEAEKRLLSKGMRSYSLLVDIKNPKALKFYQREGLYTGYQFYLMTKELKKEAA